MAAPPHAEPPPAARSFLAERSRENSAGPAHPPETRKQPRAQPAGRASRVLAAEVAAAGKETEPVAVSRGAGSGGAAGCWTAGRGMESGTADGEAGMAAGSTEAERTGAAVAETEAAADTKAGHGGSGMVAAGSRAAAVAGGEDFAGCNTESGPADHTRWGLAVHKEESVKGKDTFSTDTSE